MTISIGILVNTAKVVVPEAMLAQYEGAMPNWLPINWVNCPSGPHPGMARFLIPPDDFDNNLWNDPFDIVFTRDGSTLTLKNYVLVSASRAERKPDSAWVLEVADIRHKLRQAYSNHSWNVADDTTSDWNNVLADLVADLPAGFENISYANTAGYDVSNLRYEGWRTINALADVAHRTRNVLVYDPIAGELLFEKMHGDQDLTVLNTAPLHRVYGIPETEYVDDVGEVRVTNDFADDFPAGDSVIDNPASTSTNTQVAWGTTLAIGNPTSIDNQTELDAEAQVLADTWFDWALRKTAREYTEFFGIISIQPGNLVSTVTWQVYEGDIFTTVDIGAPPEPVTYRQPITAGSSFMQLAIMDEDITYGSVSKQASLYDSSDYPPSDTGETIDVYHDFWPDNPQTISTGQKIGVIKQGGKWRIHWAECEPETP